MQRSKTIALMTEIFNKLSSKSFISKTCQKHTSFIPMYICKTCVTQTGQSFCEECFKSHDCGNKVKGEISLWISQHQQAIGKYINNVQRQFDSCRQSMQSGKIRILTNRNQNQGKDQQKTVTELNNEILMGISKKIEKCQKDIQDNCIKPMLQGPMRTLFQNFISTIKLQINGLSNNNLSEIRFLVQNCQKSSQLAQKQIKDQFIQVKKNCSQFYERNIRKSIEAVLKSIWGTKNQSDGQFQNESKQNKNLLQYKISQLQKENALVKQMQFDLQNQISKLQQQLAFETQQNKQKQTRHMQVIKKCQTQIQKLKETAGKQQQKWKDIESQISQLEEKDYKVRKLQSKCKQYQQQLVQLARNQVNQYQKPQHRYDMEDAANRISQLSQKCQNLIIQGNSKDRKITQLIAELNKMKLKFRQNKSPIHSARKEST